MYFLYIFRFCNSNFRKIEYIIQKRYISSSIFLYHDMYLDDCTTMHHDTQCIVSPLAYMYTLVAIQIQTLHEQKRARYECTRAISYCSIGNTKCSNNNNNTNTKKITYLTYLTSIQVMACCLMVLRHCFNGLNQSWLIINCTWEQIFVKF